MKDWVSKISFRIELLRKRNRPGHRLCKFCMNKSEQTNQISKPGLQIIVDYVTKIMKIFLWMYLKHVKLTTGNTKLEKHRPWKLIKTFKRQPLAGNKEV